MLKLGITLPIYNTPITRVPELARLAEEANFDSLWTYEVFHNPYVPLTAAAMVTERIQLGTALAHTTSRPPFLTANIAADVDEYSRGRMILGLGVGDPVLLAGSGLDPSDRPLSHMSEYIDAVRAAWTAMWTGDGGRFKGDIYKAHFLKGPPNGNFRRSMHREHPPIYPAALKPRMLQLVGEKGDGVMGALYTTRYVDEIVKPNLAIGADRGERDVAEIDVLSYTICSPSEDRDEAIRRARIHVGSYCAWSGFDHIIEWEGLKADQTALREALQRDGLKALETATSDRLVETFSIAGTPDECRAKIEAYAKSVTHCLLHTPAIPPLESEDSVDAYRSILSTFERAAVAPGPRVKMAP